MMAKEKLERLGAWEIVRELGRGGMGTVYEGRARSSGERVAIKVLSKALASEAERQRFEREARILVSLESPRIVRVLDFGQDGGRPYLVMQYLEGEDLAARIERDAPLGVAAALALIQPVAEGVAELHARGILHRDLKPSNVFLTARSGPRLVDFGLARSSEDSRVTRAGDFIGTIGYAAPEILAGKMASPASDVYALGLILFELLTKTREGRRADARDRLREAVSSEPAFANAAGLVVREGLLDLVARACAQEMRARYADGTGFARALKQVTQDLARLAAPTPASVVAAPPPPAAPPRTSPFAWALLALVVAGAVGLLALMPQVLRRAGL